MTDTTDYLANFRQHIAHAIRDAAHDCGEDCPLTQEDCDANRVIDTGMGGDIVATPEDIADVIVTRLFADHRHVYLSTSCLHDDHRYCQQQTGNMGLKNPAECKFCNRSCTCTCHDRAPL